MAVSGDAANNTRVPEPVCRRREVIRPLHRRPECVVAGESRSRKKADRQTSFYTNGVRLISVFGRIKHGIEIGADSIRAIRCAGGTGRIRVSALAGIIFRTVSAVGWSLAGIDRLSRIATTSQGHRQIVGSTPGVGTLILFPKSVGAG